MTFFQRLMIKASRWKEPLGFALLALVILSIWIVPKGFHPGASILGHPESDLTKHYWNLWWAHRMVIHEGRLPFFTDYLNYPSGFHLYPIEPINQMGAVLFGSLLGFPWYTNLLALANLGFAALGMFILVRYETGSRPAAACAGLLYALSSYALWTVYVGVGELSNLGWMPLALFALLRTARDGGAKNVGITVFLFFITAFSCWYYALFVYLLAGLLMLMDPWRGTRTFHLWGRYVLIVFLSLGILFPIIKTFNQSYRSVPRSQESFGEYLHRRLETQPHDNLYTRLDLKDFFLGGDEVRARARKNPYQGGRYAGIALGLLALGSVVLRPRAGLKWLACAGAMLCLALGSRLVIGGHESGSKLPFFVFNLALERYAQAMNFPARFMMPLTLSLVVAAGITIGAVHTRLLPKLGEGRKKRAGMVFLFLIGLIPLGEARWRGDLPLPFPSRSVEALPAGPWLADHASSAAVLEIPQAFQALNRRACDEVLLLQVAHQRKSTALPIDRISAVVKKARTDLAKRPLIATLLRLSGGAPADGPHMECCEEADKSHPSLQSDLEWLVETGFGEIVVTWQGMPMERARTLRRFCTRVFGPPVFDHPLQSVFRLKSL